MSKSCVSDSYRNYRISILFFFSSRRRHTRSYGDWSSDVCSSDLVGGVMAGVIQKKMFSGRTVKAAATAMIAKAAVDFLKKQLIGAIDSSRQSPIHSTAPRNSDTNVQLSRSTTIGG